MHSQGIDLEGRQFSEHAVPSNVIQHILPNRVPIEVVDRLHLLIEKDIRSEGYISIVSRLEVGHAAGGDAETPQHCGQRQTD